MATLALGQVMAQAAATVPGWVGPTMAISLAIIALSFLCIAAGVLIAALKVAGQVRKLGTMVTGMQDDIQRTVANVRRVSEQSQDLLVLVRHEAGAYAQTGRRIRRKLNRGVDQVQERLQDLEALYDIMHAEVEDTALDVAATLRGARRGRGALGRVRRFLVPGR
ncbi:MAG TPA: hypothetical protein VFS40_02125 [Gemmatimonadales bacterium]|nr:hypothetical protein [Gemmatimonadales bacterium]